MTAAEGHHLLRGARAGKRAAPLLKPGLRAKQAHLILHLVISVWLQTELSKSRQHDSPVLKGHQ